MEVLSAEEMAARLDYKRPMVADTPQQVGVSMWCIPFEWGPNAKGTRITISKAREIASELRASVAEAEKSEVQRAFEHERAIARDRETRLSALQEEVFRLKGEVELLKKQLRASRKVVRAYARARS